MIFGEMKCPSTNCTKVHTTANFKSIHGDVIAAIEVLVPQYRAKTDELAPHIDEAARTLSTALGAQKSGLNAALEKSVERESSVAAAGARMA